MLLASHSAPNMLLSRLDLKSGWTFKQRDDESPLAWLPVKEVPSQVHLDLLANKKYIDHQSRVCEND